MNAEQERIWKYLNDNAMGLGAAKTADDIATHASLPISRTNSAIRDLIKDMRTEDGLLVGSSNRGFFIIQDENDLNTTIHHLESRVEETNRLIDSLRDSFDNR
jgi:hypothetical protein